MDYSLNEGVIDHICVKIKGYILPSKENNYKSKFLQSKTLLYCVVALFVLKMAVVLVSINVPVNIFFADITKIALENFVNQTRQSIGLPVLVENERLNQAARLKAENMIQHQYFSHTSPGGVPPWFWFSKAGYSYKYAGENLAVGFFESEEVYSAWLNSPTHKANIINPNYKEIGTAIMSGFGNNKAIVVVQEFGSQLPVVQNVVPKNNTSPEPLLPQALSEEESFEKSGDLQGQVLSQAIQTKTNSLPSEIISSVLYDYDHLLQNVIYGISFTIMIILLVLIFLNFDFSIKKQLVFRVAIIVVLLSIASSINRETIVSLIPHQILI